MEVPRKNRGSIRRRGPLGMLFDPSSMKLAPVSSVANPGGGNPTVLKKFACLLALAAVAAIPVPAADLPIPDIPYQKFTLDNGLTLLVHEDHKAPIVALNIRCSKR